MMHTEMALLNCLNLELNVAFTIVSPSLQKTCRMGIRKSPIPINASLLPEVVAVISLAESVLQPTLTTFTRSWAGKLHFTRRIVSSLSSLNTIPYSY